MMYPFPPFLRQGERESALLAWIDWRSDPQFPCNGQGVEHDLAGELHPIRILIIQARPGLVLDDHLHGGHVEVTMDGAERPLDPRLTLHLPVEIHELIEGVVLVEEAAFHVPQRLLIR